MESYKDEETGVTIPSSLFKQKKEQTIKQNELSYVDEETGVTIPSSLFQEQKPRGDGFWKSIAEIPGAAFRGIAGVPLETADLIANAAQATLQEQQAKEKPQSFFGILTEKTPLDMLPGGSVIGMIPGVSKAAEHAVAGTIEGIKKAREATPWLHKQPETKLGQMVQSGVQSAGTSIGIPLAASAINPALGAVIYAGGMPGLYGLAEKNRFMRDVKDGINNRKDLSNDEKKSFISNAEKYAWTAGAIEGGVEALSNVFVGKLLNLFGMGNKVSELTKKPLKELLTQAPKELLGKLGAMIPEELATENIQEISENELRRAAINQGLKKGEDVSNIPGIGETALMTSGSTAISTILTFGLGSAITHNERNQIKNGLISPTASDAARTKSVNSIYSELLNIDKTYADNWLLNAQKNIAQKKPPMSAEELNIDYNKLINESKAKDKVQAEAKTSTPATIWTKDWQEAQAGDILTDNLEKKIDYENGKVYVRLKEEIPSDSLNKERVDGSQPQGQESGGAVQVRRTGEETAENSGILQTQEGIIKPKNIRELNKTGILQGEPDYSKYDEEFNKVIEEIKTPEGEKLPEKPQYTERERNIIKNAGEYAVNNLRQTDSEENFNKYKDEVRTNTEIRVRKEIDQRYKNQHEPKNIPLNKGIKINNIAYAKTVDNVSGMILKVLGSPVDMTEGMGHIVNELRRRNIYTEQIKSIMVDAYNRVKPELAKIANKEKAIVPQKIEAIPNAIKPETPIPLITTNLPASSIQNESKVEPVVENKTPTINQEPSKTETTAIDTTKVAGIPVVKADVPSVQTVTGLPEKASPEVLPKPNEFKSLANEAIKYKSANDFIDAWYKEAMQPDEININKSGMGVPKYVKRIKSQVEKDGHVLLDMNTTKALMEKDGIKTTIIEGKGKKRTERMISDYDEFRKFNPKYKDKTSEEIENLFNEYANKSNTEIKKAFVDFYNKTIENQAVETKTEILHDNIPVTKKAEQPINIKEINKQNKEYGIAINQILHDLDLGESPQLLIKNTDQGEIYTRTKSSNPDYFIKLGQEYTGITKAYIKNILKKAQDGKPLTEKQSKILDELINAKTDEIQGQRKYLRSELPKVVVADLNLKVGDKFKILGEEFNVIEKDNDGNFVIKDGEEYVVDEFDKIPKPDEGSFKSEQPSTIKEGGVEYQANKYKAIADELKAMSYDKRPEALSKLSNKDLNELGKELFVSKGSSNRESYINKIASAIGNKVGYEKLNPEGIKETFGGFAGTEFGQGIEEYGKTKEGTAKTQGLQTVSGENLPGRQLANKWEKESLSKYKGKDILKHSQDISIIVVGQVKTPTDYSVNGVWKRNGEIQTYQTTLSEKQRVVDAMKAQGLTNITWRAEMSGEHNTFTHENIQELYKELNKPKSGTNLELGGFQSIYETIEKSFKSGDMKKLSDNLIELGKKVYQQGATNYDKFIKSMRNILGNMWESLKHSMVQTWKAVKIFAKEEIGAMGDIESIRNEEAGKPIVSTETETKKETTTEKSKTSESEKYLLEMPELIELVDKLDSGNYPIVKERLGHALGRFTGTGDIKSIKLLASLAENDIQARKTLTHEILHWIDYIPENTLKRGNILGHIASMVKYLRQSIDKVPTDQSKVITQEVRNEIRKEAGRLARQEGVKGKKIWERTNELNRKLLEEKKKSIENYIVYKKDIVAELKNVIREYNRDLFPDDDAGKKALEEHIQYYFNKPKEMYAEAGGAFVLRPDLFKQYAPKTLKLAIGYMENKPQAVEIYREYHNRIKNWSEEQLIKNRALEESKAYIKGEEAYRKSFLEANKVTFMDKIKDTYGGFKKEMIDKFIPIYDSIEDPAKRNRVRTIINNWLYRFSTIQAYSTDIQFRGGYDEINKAGISDANLAAYTKYLRIANSKEVKFNPGGHTAETAKLQLEHLRNEMGDAKYKILVDSTEKFLDVRQQMIESLKKLKMLSPEDYKMMEDNRYYFTFDNVKYILRRNGHAISAKMYGRIGMLGNVGNPYAATIMKDFENIKMHLLNSAKRESVKELGSIAIPANKKPISFGKDKTYLVPVPSLDKSLGLITYMEDGKIHGVYVPKDIANTFDASPINGWILTKGLQKIASPFRELFTRKRPGFWGFNYFRDFFSAVMVLPEASSRKFIPKMIKALPMAIKSIKGDIPYVNEMFRKGRIIAAADTTGDLSELTQTQRIMFKRGYTAAPEKNIALHAFDKLSTWLNFVSDVTERTTKIASSLYLDEYFPGMSQEDKTSLIRMSGTPNLLEKGEAAPIINNLLLFINPAFQGWRTQIEIAKNNPGEFAWKTFKYSVVPKALMMAGIAGMFGDWIKDLFKKISIYDLINYYTIPIGMTSTGKAVYFRIPQSEVNRFSGGLFMKAFLAVYNKQSPTKDIASLLDYTADQVPGFNPAISTAMDLLSVARGHVPYDEWRNRPAISDRNILEAKDIRTVGAYAKYFTNQLGIVGAVYKFDTDNLGEIKTTLEKALGYPIASDIIGRFIKVGDGHYGFENEQLMKGIEEEQTQTSRMHLDVTEVLTKRLKGNQLTEDDIDVLKSADPRYVKYKLKELVEVGKSGNNSLRRAINNARTEKEKMLIMKNYIDAMRERGNQ